MNILAIHTDREAAVTVLLLAIITFWLWSWLLSKIQLKKMNKILSTGVESEATVIDIGPTGRFVNNLPLLKVQINVQPEKGRNYVTQITQVVPPVDFNLLHSGSRIIVKYDPTSPKEVVLMRTA